MVKVNMSPTLPPANPENPRSSKHLLTGSWPSFSHTLDQNGLSLRRRVLRILQVNVGMRCNQTCRHCHVEAGPLRREQMSPETAERIVQLLDASGGEHLETVDLTGGAPELNPVFRYLVSEARGRGLKVIDRCNLTVLLEPGQEGTAQFLRDHQVEIVASLPCYSRENVERQRGRGVFARSIRSLLLLNGLGYGKPDTELILNLVYNPVGPFLPPDQEELEKDYKKKLREDFGIEFNQLFTIANMPIKRFLYDLVHMNRLEEYMAMMVSHFNVKALENVMCRDLISIGWDGKIYDCDFNQMAAIPAANEPRTLWSIDSLDNFNQGPIALADHCYGCTAGSGSSCAGQLM